MGGCVNSDWINAEVCRWSFLSLVYFQNPKPHYNTCKVIMSPQEWLGTHCTLKTLLVYCSALFFHLTKFFRKITRLISTNLLPFSCFVPISNAYIFILINWRFMKPLTLLSHPQHSFEYIGWWLFKYDVSVFWAFLDPPLPPSLMS